MHYVKYILFFCAGLIYSIILTFLGLILTGMGHGTGTSVFWMLALAPVPLIYWAGIGLLLCWRDLNSIKIIIVSLVLLHYLTFVVYSYVDRTNNEHENFPAVWQRYSGGVILTILVYLAGQFVIWGLLFFSSSEKYQVKLTAKFK